MLFFHKPGIVNVKMIITEEKILSNIDKVQKMINPSSKKQIIQLEEDAFFKDLIDSIKVYLVEYPKKKNFPVSVYKSAHALVEYTTTQFEENTKQIENLIRQREENIATSKELKETLDKAIAKEKDWKTKVKEISDKVSEDAIEALTIIGKSRKTKTENYETALKLVNAKISNLEANLHIEIDMERIEDRLKALSYIGIEIAEALKEIPAPSMAVVDKITEKTTQKATQKVETVDETEEFIEQTRFEVKPSLWQRFKNSKFVRTLSCIWRIRIVIDVPALPEGKEQN